MADLYQLNAEFYKPYLTLLKYFRVTAIDIFGEKHPIYKFKYLYCFGFLLFLLNTVSHWCYVIEKIYGGADLLELAVDLSYCYNSIEGCLLYLHICIIKTRIKNFVMKLETQWRNDDSLSMNIVLLKRQQVKQLNLYNFIYCTLLTGLIHFHLGSPLLIMLFKKFILKYDEPAYITPFQFSLPFDYEDNIIKFIIIYMWDYLMAGSLAYLINCSLFFLTVTMNQLGVLFILLQADFREIIQSRDKDIDIKLKNTIKRHIVLSELLIELSSAYGAIFAIHLFFLSATICFYGIAAAINGRPEDFKNCLISVLTIANIFHCCKHGQLVTDSGRHDMPSNMKKMIKNFHGWIKREKHLDDFYKSLQRCKSQRATYIRSTSFTEVSLKTFLMIMKMSWSFISFMATICED